MSIHSTTIVAAAPEATPPRAAKHPVSANTTFEGTSTLMARVGRFDDVRLYFNGDMYSSASIYCTEPFLAELLAKAINDAVTEHKAATAAQLAGAAS